MNRSTVRTQKRGSRTSGKDQGISNNPGGEMQDYPAGLYWDDVQLEYGLDRENAPYRRNRGFGYVEKRAPWMDDEAGDGYPVTEGYRRRMGNRPAALNFLKFAAEGNRFINDVSRLLGTNRNRAARITRAVLHALRDRVPADDAIEFAQGLPMALKGVWIDQYDLSKTPVIIRNQHDFIDYIWQKNRFAVNDFQSPDDVVRGLQAVVQVLERYVDRGQLEQMKNQLNLELRELMEA